MKGFINLKRLIFGLLAVALAICLAAPPASAGAFWKQKYERMAATAGETLAVGEVVCIKASDSKAYKADADDSDLRPAVGVIGKGGASGATVEIIIRGILAGMDEASPGYRLYLSTTAGAMSMTAPTNNKQLIGWVMPETAATAASTIYFIDVRQEPSPGQGF